MSGRTRVEAAILALSGKPRARAQAVADNLVGLLAEVHRLEDELGTRSEELVQANERLADAFDLLRRARVSFNADDPIERATVTAAIDNALREPTP